MMLVGLTGSIATGKSEVANILIRQGIPVFDSDKAVHLLYENGQAAQKLQHICPTAVQGKFIDRSILSKEIAQKPFLLKAIEQAIHPLVQKMQDEFVKKARAENHTIAVIDSPLLIESGVYKKMDVVVLVDATEKQQVERAMKRPSMTEEKLSLIMAKQMPSEKKRIYADFVIENEGTLLDLERKTIALITKIREGQLNA